MTLKTSYGHQIGDYVENKVTGLKGHISSIQFFIAGCEYVSLQCSHQENGHIVSTSDFCSSHVIELIHNNDTEEFSKLLYKNIDSLDFRVKPGCRVKHKYTNEILIVSDVCYSNDGMVLITGFSEIFKPVKEDATDTIFSSGDIEFVDDGYRDRINSVLTERKNGSFEMPEVGDHVRCFVNGMEGHVKYRIDSCTGTSHVYVTPKVIDNIVHDVVFYDVELVEIIKKVK